jgi:GT2 family glycosyltransferase
MSTSTGPSVHAIVVTYERLELLRGTMHALDRQSRRPDTITVVDNAGDPRVRSLVEGLATGDYVSTSTNLGPAGAFAVGMVRNLALAADDSLLLLVDDDDPPVFEDVIERLVRVHELATTRLGGVGTTGSRFDRKRGRLVRVLDDELTASAEPVPVDHIPGNAFPLYATRAVRDVGVYDPSLFFGFEELEYCLRMRDRGWVLAIDPQLTLDGRRMWGRLNLEQRPRRETPQAAWRRYYSARNITELARRYGSSATTVRVATEMGLFAGLRAAVKLRDPREALPAWLGTYDAARRRLGRTVRPGWEP